MIIIRELDSCELTRIGEVDRSEEILQEYIIRGGNLHIIDKACSVPRWTPDPEGTHSIRGKIAVWRSWLDQGGTLFGAFDGETLVAFAVYSPKLSLDTAQFALLHVSRPYRRRGLGALLAARVIEAAKEDGASRLYVSSAPTKGTVEFYLSLGFLPAQEVNRDLFELEPDDIHMTLDLCTSEKSL